MLVTIYTSLLFFFELYTTAFPVPQPSVLTKRTFSSTAVMPQTFPDPSLIQDPNGNWWTFASNNTDQNVPVATSSDFNTWTVAPPYDALPGPGSWTASEPFVWAPDVIQLVSVFHWQPWISVRGDLRYALATLNFQWRKRSVADGYFVCGGQSSGSYVMYYSAAWSGNESIHCIGAATSTSIQGPYAAQPQPWVCPST